MVAARLSLNAYFNTITHVANATWGLTVRLNGGPWRNRFLTPTEVDAINTPGSAGNMAMLLDVPLGDLVAGVNTLELLPLNAPMDNPPVVANIDLTLSSSDGSAPAAPTNLRIRS
jgi:hypothetical protein